MAEPETPPANPDPAPPPTAPSVLTLDEFNALRDKPIGELTLKQLGALYRTVATGATLQDEAKSLLAAITGRPVGDAIDPNQLPDAWEPSYVHVGNAILRNEQTIQSIEDRGDSCILTYTMGSSIKVEAPASEVIEALGLNIENLQLAGDAASDEPDPNP